MSEQPQDGAPPPRGIGAKLAAFANALNDNVVGSPWTLLTAIILVIGADVLIPVQGFSKWNVTTGLFFNTQSSNIELITGVAAVVAVVSVRRAQKQQHKELKDHRAETARLHKRIDDLLHHRPPAAPASVEKTFSKTPDGGSEAK